MLAARFYDQTRFVNEYRIIIRIHTAILVGTTFFHFRSRRIFLVNCIGSRVTFYVILRNLIVQKVHASSHKGSALGAGLATTYTDPFHHRELYGSKLTIHGQTAV